MSSPSPAVHDTALVIAGEHGGMNETIEANASCQINCFMYQIVQNST